MTSQTINPEFPCVPSCIECRRAGLCSKPLAQSFAPNETVQARKPRDPHAGIVVLPCGCWGLPWPLVHKLGDNFDEIFCDRHGWMKVTAEGKKRMKKTANRMAFEATQPTLDEVPY